MEQGTSVNIGGGCYEFTSDEERKKTGLKAIFRDSVAVPAYGGEFISWHCPRCRKVMLWLDSRE